MCSASFLKCSNSLFGEGTEVESRNFSIWHQILTSHPKEERLTPRKENGSFLGITSALIKKKPRYRNIFQGRILSRMEEATLRSRKGDTWGSESESGGLRSSQLFVGGGGVILSVEEMAPQRRGRSAETAARPSQSLTPAPPSSCGPHTVVGLRCL